VRILQLHNLYRQEGGEDVAVHSERELLRACGHSVDLLEARNSEILGLTGKVKASLSTIYSPGAKERVAARIAAVQPDVVHVHNFFPLLSPSIYYACSEAGVPVVQTLHNYVLICPNGQLLRDGHVCEDCLGSQVPWRSVLHGCYRGGRAGSVAVTTMLATHRFLETWEKKVDAYIALTDFSREKLIEGGLPANKISVKPNFAPDAGRASGRRGNFGLFVGRLSREKGIATLLSAWERVDGKAPLKVAGDGPLAEHVARAGSEARIDYLGMQPRDEVRKLMEEAAFLVLPSIWYEGFPMVIVEAFSVGLPVIASNLGSMATLVEHRRTGLHFRPGDAEDLAAKIDWAVNHPEEMARMGHEARKEYLAKYTPEHNYEMLMEIYRQVTSGKKAEKAVMSCAGNAR
jgi:glycosyltransferase involved in cell wall biosynthesis